MQECQNIIVAGAYIGISRMNLAMPVIPRCLGVMSTSIYLYQPPKSSDC